MALMNCRDCRDELELQIGQTDLPQEIGDHLANCAECRAWWNELHELTTLVADDAQFELSAAEVHSIENGINGRLDAGQSTVVTPLNWLRRAAVAASVIIVAGIGFTGYRANWFGVKTGVIDTTVLAQSDSQSGGSTFNEPGDGLNDEDYSILTRAIDSTAQFDNANALDSLSDEQIDYLESHLDVRGLI